MQSFDTTPRFRNLSINGTPTFSSVFDSESTTTAKGENACFMCRQANIYVNPIGTQRERRVARRHPPPLSRAQIEELSQKKHLTKREVRLLLQCYFPEIKNVKYFQLHKFHSCCYDPKHMNLCKNHITALQHEQADHGHHGLHKHNDEDHFRKYERNGGEQNRVSFVRIKIEPTKGIPTRFLGPTALPESLADMLLKQVNRLENKKRQPSFSSDSQTNTSMYNIRRIGQSNGQTASTASEYLGTLESDDEFSSDDEYEEETHHPNTAVSHISGFNGKSRDHSRRKRERRLQTISEKQTSTNADLVVEDVEELEPLFVLDTESTKKKKKSRKRVKKPQHIKPKLNHWEQLALEQSQQQACGCRHHIRRLEADKVVYDWCRCKDHLHKDMKLKPKDTHESIQTVTETPPPPPKKSTGPKKKTGTRKIEPSTAEMALAYDPTTVDYDVIQEVLYFRTASGRLVKPEISNSLAFNDSLKARGMNPYKSYSKFPSGSLSSRNPTQNEIKRTSIKRQSAANSPIFFTEDSLLDGKIIQHGDRTTSTTGLITVREVPESPIQQMNGYFGMKEKSYTENFDNNIQYKPPHIEEEEEEEEEDDDDEDANKVNEDFVPPKYLPQNPDARSTPSPLVPFRMQKSSKPTFKNHRPTPNFERESSLLANRRWYDQALGDQNLLPVHDGRFGLIAGVSAQDYYEEEKLPDNDYTEADTHGTRSNCTIS